MSGRWLEGSDAVESEGADGDGLGAEDESASEALDAEFEFDLADEFELWGDCKRVHRNLLIPIYRRIWERG